jgi:hypothetical protein
VRLHVDSLFYRLVIELKRLEHTLTALIAVQISHILRLTSVCLPHAYALKLISTAQDSLCLFWTNAILPLMKLISFINVTSWSVGRMFYLARFFVLD